MHLRIVVLTALMSSAAIAGASANDCEDKVTGRLDSAPLNFSYASWAAERTQQRDWLFVHCLANFAERPLWIDWKLPGSRLHGWVQSGTDKRSERTSTSDTQKQGQASLWYGPQKAEMTTDLILRHNEGNAAASFAPLFQLAQFSTLNADMPLSEILADPDLLGQLLKSIDAPSLTMYAYASIAVPVSHDAAAMLEDSTADPATLEAQLLSVQATLFERIETGDDGQPVSRIGLFIGSAEMDFAALEDRESFPSIAVSSEDGTIAMLQGLDNTITLNQPVLQFIEPVAVPVQAVDTLVQREITLTFGDALAVMTLTLESTR